MKSINPSLSLKINKNKKKYMAKLDQPNTEKKRKFYNNNSYISSRAIQID